MRGAHTRRSSRLNPAKNYRNRQDALAYLEDHLKRRN
jgi:hypothetical protein